MTAIFFDIGDTLATPIVAGSPPRLQKLIVFPYINPILERLARDGYRLGLISNTGDETGEILRLVLKDASILRYFADELMVFSGDYPDLPAKPNPALFQKAKELAGDHAQLLFVGEDSKERETARDVGFTVVPHPKLVEAVLGGSTLSFAALVSEEPTRTAWAAISDLPVVPLRAEERPANRLIAIMPSDLVPALERDGYQVTSLGEPGLPDLTDLFIVRDDQGGRAGLAADNSAEAAFAGAKGVVHLGRDGNSHLLALRGGIDVESVHLSGAEHGHTIKLVASDAIYDARPVGFDAGQEAWEAADVSSDVFDHISSDQLAEVIAQLSGAADVGPGQSRLRSRHIAHPDNVRAVDLIEAKLRSIGDPLTIRRQRFGHRGRSLFNLEAVLQGGSEETVIVGAHLDSTAANDAGYRPDQDPAPGADDDGSGIVALLAIAEVFVAKVRTGWQPQRTLRFAFFNGEEQGLVGSQAYARFAHASGLSVTGVLQLDMIGYNPTAPGRWEAHGGTNASLDVEARSLDLAKVLLAAGAPEDGTLDLLQIYSGRTEGGDPAAGRSDHASFHEYGVAAIAVSTDFFPGPEASSPEADPNPAYHSAADTLVHASPMAAIVRSVGRAAWALAGMTKPDEFGSAKPQSSQREDRQMSGIGRFDARPYARSRALPEPRTPLPTGAFSATAGEVVHLDALTDHLGAAPSDLGERAIAYVQRLLPRSFDGSSSATFVADPVVRRTSAGAAAVNLSQYVKGVPVFQTSRTVQFDINGKPVDAPGTTALIQPDLDVLPTVDVRDAVHYAATWLEKSIAGTSVKDEFGEISTLPEFNVLGWSPELKTQFQLLPSLPSVVDAGPFGADTTAQLVVFSAPDGARLAWQCAFTLPDDAAHYLLLIAADAEEPALLYSANTDNNAAATGLVYETSPGLAQRTAVSFPRSLSDFPIMPTTPLAGFPADWIDGDMTIGNSTIATLGNSQQSLKGSLQGGVLEFSPQNQSGDDQKLLNIFYFCSFMHDFLFLLGFDEASGNFQKRNLTLKGRANDAVRARAHSGAVYGTANMSTPADGTPPIMNMGLVTSTNRHTAFDADVVLHEYTHGLTNRLVGGGLNAQALDAPQSGAMGEGWGDYYALTIVGWMTSTEKVVTGDWVTNNPGGIRRYLYDENFPITYGNVVSQLGGGQPDAVEVHDAGELWCATLMAFTRRLRAALGEQDGYRVAWTCVTDGLKLTPANPSFLEARNAILKAVDDLKAAGRLSPDHHRKVRRAGWEAFAKFGMGASASSADPGWDGVSGASDLPADF